MDAKVFIQLVKTLAGKAKTKRDTVTNLGTAFMKVEEQLDILSVFEKSSKKKKKKKKPFFRYVIKLDNNHYCTWVNEEGGYFAYCTRNGELRPRSGHSPYVNRTWSSVGMNVLERNYILEILT